jgi:hypothetical protein
VRKEYSKLRKGMVALQAQYRMKKQQNLYSEMKTELQRRSVVEAEIRTLREANRSEVSNVGGGNLVMMTDISEELTDDERRTRLNSGPHNRAVTSVNHLEVGQMHL